MDIEDSSTVLETVPEAATQCRDRQKPADTITLEIIRGKLLALADEMGIVLARTAMSPVIYEVLDFACGFCDPQGELVAQTNGITVFTGTFALHVDVVRRKYAGQIRPGDIYMSNNPYEGGTHLNDVAIIKPTFVDDELLGFAISIAHWTDVGGKMAGSLPADATEIYQEGIRFVGVRLYDEGKRQDDMFDTIAANVRLPKMSLGDLNAELASVRIADRRMQELCAKYGSPTVREAFRHIIETSEKLSRAAVAALPDGIYEATDWIDGDGIRNQRFPVKVQVRIEGDEMMFDFSECCPQLMGPVNCSSGGLFSAVKTVFKALVDPRAPSNEGYFKPMKVIAPEGTVFTAVPPAPVGWYYEGTGQASELAWKALAPLVPERFSAGSANSLCVTVLAGHDPVVGETFVLVEPSMVGWGATDLRDGASVVSAITNGDTFNYSLELLEAKFPLRVVAYGLNVEGGVGAGRFRGGFGSVREYEMLAPNTLLSASFGRSIERPWGLDSGGEGSCNYFEVLSNGKRWRGARKPITTLQPGDRVKEVTGGGGGCGDPLTRPALQVFEDVRDGYITPRQARTQYGVVVRPRGRLDEAATRKLRDRLMERSRVAAGL
jgi:N-methylhydantoinase B